jgi:RNA polymerase sigma-70 factor (ECF subfamily)
MHEEALIRRAQNGDARAFEELLGAYYGTLYKFAYKWCGNREDAEDVTQQACLKLARSIDQFRFDAAFTSWLYRLVINCAKDWSKRQQRHAHREDIDESMQISSESDSAENRLLAWQVLVKLDSFPDGIKETLLLVHAEGLTHGEAAKILGVKESTVSWRLHEARKTLNLLFGQGAVYD